ncbi:MAG: NAD(P)/FAD-dependent oxidoreductase [Tepidisphaeraceae bacterium]|jgi:2-polyprenyl-6-methoxyphenol hydroxylase-like FAD-dependent oxidoreductase
MKILIVGGGLGGMMLAACCQRRGLDYLLMEKSPDFAREGYSLGMWINGRRLFEKLGATDRFDAAAIPIGDYFIRDLRGRLLRHLDLREFVRRYGMGYSQISRRLLHELLMEKVDRSRIETGRKWTAVVSEKEFDVIVGADGVHSDVRAAAFDSSPGRFTGWRAWYAWIDARFVERGTMTEYLGAGKSIALFDDGARTLAMFFAHLPPPPVLRGRAGVGAERRLATETPTLALLRSTRGGEEIRSVFASDLTLLPGVLDGLSDSDIMSTDVARVNLQNWVRDRFVLLGDAAHGFEPHTGMGASLAMEDAYVLAEELEKAANGQPLAKALGNYQVRRQPRVAIARRLNGRIDRLTFTRSRLGRRFADWAIPFIPAQAFLADYFQLFDEQVLS